MRMYDLIEKKKRNESLDEAEVRFMVRGFTEGAIPDYQDVYKRQAHNDNL